MPTSREIHANGLRHHVLAWDGPAHRTLVLLHGYLDHAASFAPIGDHLAAAGHRVFAPDFRGHGESEWVAPGAYYHFPDYVADLAALIEVLAPEVRVGIVAHSMGGTVATYYSGVRPERVAALALLEGIGPPAMPPDVAPDRTRRWLEALADPASRSQRAFASIDDAVERLRMAHAGSVPADVLARVAKELTRPHPSGNGWTWRFDPLHQTTSPGRFDIEAFAYFARRITAPTLLLDSGASGLRHVDFETRRRLYAHAATASVEGAGHMMHWTRPDDVAREVLQFLARHMPR